MYRNCKLLYTCDSAQQFLHYSSCQESCSSHFEHIHSPPPQPLHTSVTTRFTACRLQLSIQAFRNTCFLTFIHSPYGSTPPPPPHCIRHHSVVYFFSLIPFMYSNYFTVIYSTYFNKLLLFLLLSFSSSSCS